MGKYEFGTSEYCHHGILGCKCVACSPEQALTEQLRVAEARAERAEADAKVLAAEVKAWRDWRRRVVRYMTAEVPDPQPLIDALKESSASTDSRGALGRYT